MPNHLLDQAGQARVANVSVEFRHRRQSPGSEETVVATALAGPALGSIVPERPEEHGCDERIGVPKRPLRPRQTACESLDDRVQFRPLLAAHGLTPFFAREARVVTIAAIFICQVRVRSRARPCVMSRGRNGQGCRPGRHAVAPLAGTSGTGRDTRFGLAADRPARRRCSSRTGSRRTDACCRRALRLPSSDRRRCRATCWPFRGGKYGPVAHSHSTFVRARYRRFARAA